MALRPSLPTSEAKKKPSSSMDTTTTLKKKPSLPSTTTIIRAPPSDPVSCSKTNKLKPQHYDTNPNSTHKKHAHPTPSDPIHTQTHLLTKSLSLSGNSKSYFFSKSLEKHSQATHKQERQVKENTNSSKKGGSKEVKVVIVEDEKEEAKRASVSLVRRKSFSDSKIELKEFLSSVSARIVAADMAPFMQIHAVSCARKAHDSVDKPSCRILASTVKKEFDGVYGPAWHCIVGTSFGSFVTHSVGGFLYFSIDHKLYFLLFKTTVQKAD